MQFMINTSIPITFEKIKDSEDSRFMSVKIEVAHEGKNLNNSYFSKEILEKMGKTISNIPIVGYIEKKANGEEDFKGHEMKITVTEDGIDYTYLGQAYGMIPENNNARFETKVLDNGESKNYLVVDGILWNKFEECTKIFEEDGFRWQSMELFPESIQGNFSDDKCFHFTDAIVESLCILGKTVNPAMAGATVTKYSYSTIKEQLQEMLEELKESNFSKSENNTESIGSGVFSINATQTIENSKEEEQVPNVNKTKKDIADQFSLTTNQLYDELSRKLGESKYKTTNWYGEEYEVSKFYMTDFDDSFVYAVDREDKYVDVKIPYSKNGDDVSFDFDKSSRIKWSPMDWESGTDENEEMVVESYTVKILEEVKKDFDKAIEEKDELSKKLEKTSDSLLELNEKFTNLEETVVQKNAEILEKSQEVESLNQFKRVVEQTKRQEKVEQLFGKYKKNLTKEDIESLKEKESTFSLFEEFEKEVKLFVADKIADEISTPEPSATTTTFTKMGVPPVVQETPVANLSVWDRLEQK